MNGDNTQPSLTELAAERKRINKAYKEAVAIEKAKRKPLEDAIASVLPDHAYANASHYKCKVADKLAAMHDAGELTFRGLPNPITQATRDLIDAAGDVVHSRLLAYGNSHGDLEQRLIDAHAAYLEAVGHA